MYEQQLQYLPPSAKRKTLNSIYKVMIEKLNPKKIAGIVHDKDMNQDGELVTPHVHIVLQFENQRSVIQLAKLIEEPQISAFQQWKGNVNNAYSYLIHQTNDALEKYQYDVNEVKANFDYPELMATIAKKVKQKSNQHDSEIIKRLLDQLGEGEMTKEEVISNLTGSQFAKAKKQINDVAQQVQAEKAKIWLIERKKNNQPITVIWIYGQSETGKTLLAKQYAKTRKQAYYVTGSSKDSFQHYEGEHIVILDELRPKTFPYDDLLKMLDPYGENPKAPRRFFDKSLMVDLFIITSPYDPKQFYDEIFNHKESVDSFKQLQRRITFVQLMTPTYIEMQEYNPHTQTCVPVKGTRFKNKLLETVKQQENLDSHTTYQKFNQLLEQKQDKQEE